VQRIVKVGGDFAGRQAGPSRAGAVDPETQLGCLAFDPGVQIHQTGNRMDPLGDFCRLGAQSRVIIAEKLDLDRPRIARKIV